MSTARQPLGCAGISALTPIPSFPTAHKEKSMRCKMRIHSLEKGGTDEQPTFNLTAFPVVSSDPNSENGRYWRATPAGSLQLSTINPAAVEGLEPGMELYVDITPAAPAAKAA